MSMFLPLNENSIVPLLFIQRLPFDLTFSIHIEYSGTFPKKGSTLTKQRTFRARVT